LHISSPIFYNSLTPWWNYCSVHLLDTFKAFFVQSKDNTAIQIKAGTKLELDRYLPSQGLIAKYENETVVINNSIRSRFVPLQDDTEYTLTEVVDRLTASLLRGSSTMLLRTYLLCSFFKHSGIWGLWCPTTTSSLNKVYMSNLLNILEAFT
jgi:hypothetical protein